MPRPHVTNFSVEFKFHPNKKATIIKAPFSGGQPKGGVELGPDYIMNAGFEKQIQELGWETAIVEPLHGTKFEQLKTDEKDDYGVKNTTIVNDCNKRIFDASVKAHKDGTLPVTIGGDHSIGTATVAAALENNPDTCVLWIDAHADINSPKTSDSGNLHGCPVSFIMGIDKDSYPPEFSWVPAKLKPGKIAYIGLRDVDTEEKRILREYNIPAFSMYHVDKYGIGKVVEMALDKINPDRKFPIHLSYDIDAIDPSFVPATGTRVEGGLTLREGLFVAEDVAQTGLLSSLDVVETNPLLADHEDHVLDTVSAACAIGRCALGETLL
ncbi:CIC11C00000004770 [Sungouiella intermedia]|uniref:Arginase n=1 Tax=Sungouiella intermedia TaxID=45354 RepID=A0A1L0BI09_9ASCO|nr:CIC11C00000004770 [[Candida] intermedia]